MAKRAFTRFLLIIFVLCLFSFSIPSFAATAAKSITVTYSNYKLTIDGNLVIPRDAAGNKVEIFAHNGSTYLPVRAVGNALNKKVTWDGNSKTVYLNDQSSAVTSATADSTSNTTGKTGSEIIPVSYPPIKININGTIIIPKDANGNVVQPLSYNGTTYLPVRAIGTAFGMRVGYDNNTKTISLMHQLKVSFLNVGQADAIFIELPNQQTMLIDAGNAENGKEIVDYIKKQGYDTIHYLVATHPHADHIGGMTYVVNNLSIQSIYMPKTATTTKTYEDLLTAIRNKGLKISTAKAGIHVININNLKITMIAPNRDRYDDLNNDSAVIKIAYGTNAFLFMGDAEALSENEITADVKADVIKVGHHGSTSSTSQTFLNKVSPKYAVISVGAENDYGHPAQTTLSKLSSIGAKIYRTDQDGTIVFLSDGANITVNKGSSTSVPNNASKNLLSKNIIISKVDKSAELVTIKNNGNTDINMMGWRLVSMTGNQTYTFPSYILKVGSTVTVASGGAKGNLFWTSNSVWNNTTSDPAELYDPQGNLISAYDC